MRVIKVATSVYDLKIFRCGKMENKETVAKIGGSFLLAVFANLLIEGIKIDGIARILVETLTLCECGQKN